MERIERIRGCLIGGAVGDALGAPTEFMRWSQIADRYGPEGIVDFDESYGRVGAITDDTQMTLFTVEALVQAIESADGRLPVANEALAVELHLAYLRWLRTQGVSGAIDVELSGDLIEISGLWSRRAPGNTCLSALREATVVGKQAANNSKGCGGVMRTAPLGFLGGGSYELGCLAAGLTHGHPSGKTSAGALSFLIGAIKDGASITDAVSSTIERLARDPAAGEVLAMLRTAATLAASEFSGPPTPSELGEGWVGEEALAIAVWSVVRHRDDPAHAVRVAANHDGDTDSTASVAGQIVGAAYGTAWMDEFDLPNLELSEEIDALAWRYDAALG